MKRWIKRGAWALLVLVALGVAAVVVALQWAERKAQRHIDLKPYALAVPADAAAVTRGAYLFASRGCAECHGADAAGRVFVEDPQAGLKVRGPNITPGGVVIGYEPADWERAIRHGVGRDGRPLRIMPSEDYNRYTDADAGALVAYLRQLPAVDGGAAELQFPVPMRVLYAFGAIPDAAEKIDHARPPSQPVPEAVDTAHGAYVANMCIGCHGSGLSGGKIPGGPPDWPVAANLTPGAGSAMPAYAEAAAFARMMRTGLRPDGRPVSPVMPFGALSKMSDVDLQALHAYLKTLAPRAAGGR
ncbi:MAG TPA: c-type cytochrome [Methylibium sp.]|nr:c-type cytochrome [Methylibium sp.]